ncbi:MAG: ABC transporter ATP-binding protein [Desulfobacterales bacterium]
MKNPVIDIKDIAFSYENEPILNDITFRVAPNEFFIIIGPNGSGKSTLLKLISGLLEPLSGHIDIGSIPLKHYSRKALARKIALVPQISSVDFPFTVLEVVLMGRAPHLGMLGLEQKQDVEIAWRSLEFTGIAPLAYRKVTRLSGGEQQRVFIARAICQEPEIILLDEPTAALDLAHQIRVMDLMEQLKAEKGITIVMVSHDVNLAAMYGERLLLLKSGHIVRAGHPREVITYDILEKAYGCTLLVDESPLGNFPRITQVPKKYLAP